MLLANGYGDITVWSFSDDIINMLVLKGDLSSFMELFLVADAGYDIIEDKVITLHSAMQWLH